MSTLFSSCKRDFLDIYHFAVEAVKPAKLVRKCLAFDGSKLVFDNKLERSPKSITYDLSRSRVHVIGGGKCVLGMATGLAEIAHDSNQTNRFSQGSLSLPVDMISSLDTRVRKLLDSLGIVCEFGSKNNLPDCDSVRATERILNCVREATREDMIIGLESIFIVLLSGGGSACLTRPKHITLEKKLEVTQRLVQAGADIIELNTFRRCFSEVKGGNLARLILGSNPGARVLALIMSDVIGDPIEFIASGPTCVEEDPRDAHQAMARILSKYGIEVPPSTRDDEDSTGPLRTEFVTNAIVCNNQLAIDALTSRAQDLGYRVTSLGNSHSGSTIEVLHRMLHHIDNHPFDNKKSLIVCGGESTVVKDVDESWGIGGRTQEMALDYMIEKLREANIEGMLDDRNVDIFFAASTDGQDGPTDVAGCLASVSDWSNSNPFKIHDLLQAKKSHDSNRFWTCFKPDWLVRTGPTGTNVMDLYMIMHGCD